MDLMDTLLPHRDKLQKDSEGCYFAEVLDAELDVVKLLFNGDGTVNIETEKLTYVKFTNKNLKTMVRLISESDSLYEEEEEDF
jgi:hypothetical protein|tara:strand:- start:142 stop:390 length:249 start_codon:yes stop_codon:yes gene_type:complete